MNTLQKRYNDEIQKALLKKFGQRNVMQSPRLTKIVVNMGVKDAVLDKKNIERASEVLATITGQKPRVAKAKKSIATFKLRQGDPIGLVVTMRGERMYAFFDRLVSIVLPRFKDFHGVKRESFDDKGNYTLGFSEHAVFPEIDPGTVDRSFGLEISFVNSATNKEEGLALLEALGMPFAKEAEKH